MLSLKRRLTVNVFLSERKIFLGTQNVFQSASVNELLVFESLSLRVYCIALIDSLQMITFTSYENISLYHSLAEFTRRSTDVLLLFFPENKDLTFHANCA